VDVVGIRVYEVGDVTSNELGLKEVWSRFRMGVDGNVFSEEGVAFPLLGPLCGDMMSAYVVAMEVERLAMPRTDWEAELCSVVLMAAAWRRVLWKRTTKS